jgi:hypothetical protein
MLPWCLRLASLGLVLALGAPVARAEGGSVSGYGFELRLPNGFKPAGASDEDDGCERAFRRRSDAGDLRLTVASSRQSSATEAELEMSLGGALDGLELALEGLEGEPHTEPVRVSGAQDAHQTTLVGSTRSERRLSARRGTLFVSASLSSPAEAEAEAQAAWSSLLLSLRLEEPGGGLARLLPYLVALVGLAALGLRLLRRGTDVVRLPPVADGSAAFRGAEGREPPAVESVPYEPARLPSHVPVVPREPQGSLSRAADGMPLFDAATKARGGADDLLRLPAPPTRRTAPEPEAASEPKRTPTLRPPTPVIRL